VTCLADSGLVTWLALDGFTLSRPLGRYLATALRSADLHQPCSVAGRGVFKAVPVATLGLSRILPRCVPQCEDEIGFGWCARIAPGVFTGG
jgi:hypothetical protein